ncbi:MAG: CPBP family glutamic-type intramembrane protease, partial [Anaerolineales bacterium]
NWVKNSPITAFFVLTFVIAWSIWLPVGLLAPQYFLLTVIPGAWAPSISAVLLTGLAEGKTGIRQFLGKLLKWRVGFQWYLIVLFGIAAIAYAAVGINLLFGGRVPEILLPDGLPPDTWLVVLPILFLVNIFVGGPLAEDIGWRGYILPKLRERMNALNASLVIGIVWVLWHAPFYFFPEGRVAVGHVPFIWFALMTIAWSVLFAWVYVNTESILMPVLFHAAINTTLGTLGVLGQSSGDIMPLILNTVLTWVAVGVVVIVFGRDLTRKASSIAINIDAELNRT